MTDSNNPESDNVPEMFLDLVEGAVQSRVASGNTETESQIGSYRLSELLGESPASAVYRAEFHRATHVEVVALRLIKVETRPTEVIARFESERQVLALMSHPNVAKVLDASSTKQGAPYFVTEFVPGVALTSYCEQYSLDTRKRLELFVAVCSGAQHAHQHGLIHQDLNPNNILVSVEAGGPVPKIIDFGVAQALNESPTGLGKSSDRSAYQSPEQRAGAADIDSRTDIYSLGVLLRELISGARPPRSVTPHNAENREKELPAGLDSVVARATAEDRVERYQSASELSEDIRRHLAKTRAHSRLSRSARSLRTLAVKVPTPLAVGAALFLALLGVLLSVQLRTPETAAAVAPEPTREVAAKLASESVTDVAEQLVHSSQELNSSGRGHVAAYGQVSTEVTDLRRQHQDERLSLAPWQPVWEREKELSLWRRVLDAEEQIGRHYTAAFHTLVKAHDTAPADSSEREQSQAALVRLRQYQDGLVSALGSRALGPFVEALHRASGVAVEAGAVISITSNPDGADVFCFRFESREGRRVPLAFNPALGRDDPAKGIIGEPILVVERIWDSGQGVPFKANDTLISINGAAVQTRTELARVLRNVAPDDAVTVTARRSGKRRTLTWVPFPGSRYEGEGALRPPLAVGRVVNFRAQFGFTLSGYPLQFVDGCHLGSTQSGKELKTWLPMGSYLLVSTKDGHVDARQPVFVTGQATNLRTRLLEAGAMPPEFVYVPAGPFTSGGGLQAIPGPEYTEREVAGFLISGLEVTVREYLEFLNDPLEHISKDGLAIPAIPSTRAYLKSLRKYAHKDRLSLVPTADNGSPLCVRDNNGRWKEKRVLRSLDWPILGVSQLAAREYAHWYTQKHNDGRRYRLPTDLEWEKSARGVDRRTYVWGNYPVWSFCWCNKAIYDIRTPTAVGVSPLDESVYGVRDLGGSVSELIANRTSRAASWRGGNWRDRDDTYFRTSTHSSRAPESSAENTGFRLVAELKPLEVGD